MDCGTPFCHTGKLINGMASGLPDQQPDSRLERPRLPRAVEGGGVRLHQTNNFPEFTGRVCPAPCEGSCTLALNDEAVTIKAIECAIVDRAFERGLGRARAASRPHRQVRRHRRVGPGGARLRRATEQRGPHRDRLRARRPDRRPADVRHPEHEARQDGRRAACPADGRFRRALRDRRRGRAGHPGGPAASRLRRRGSLLRRDRRARPPRRGTGARRRPLRDGVPAREHEEPARLRARRRAVHLREGQAGDRHRRGRHRH